MSVVHCKNPISGITYVYESTPYFDETENKTKYKRRCIGQLSEDGTVVPNPPRGGYRGRKSKAGKENAADDRSQSSSSDLKITTKQLEDARAEILELKQELISVKKERDEMEAEINRLIRGMEKLINRH